MKDNFRRDYLRKTKLIMKSRHNDRNKIIAINIWAMGYEVWDRYCEMNKMQT